MNVTPVGRLEFVLSKLIPYWVVGILVVTVGMLIGWLVYGLVPEGNIANIYLAAILFSLVMSGLGVFIANRSANYPTKYIHDVRFHHRIPVDERTVHAHCIHAPVGTVHHLCDSTTLFHRDHALRLSERGYHGRPLGAICHFIRLCPTIQPRGSHDIQEESVKSFYWYYWTPI